MAQDRRDAHRHGGDWYESNAGFHPSRGMHGSRMGNESWFDDGRRPGNPRVPGSSWSARSGWGEAGRYPRSQNDESREWGGYESGGSDERFAWGGGHAPGYGRQGERATDRMEDDGWRAQGSAGSERDWQSHGGGDWRSQGGGRSSFGAQSGQDSYGNFGYGSGQAGGYGGFGYYERGSFGMGSEGRSSFSGRGPKGYKRSEERVREDVCERLSAHPDIDASEIEVKIEDGEVVLSGTVESRREKRLAEDCLEGIPGVEDVRNELRVQRSKGSDSSRQGNGNTNLVSTDSLLPSSSRQGQSANARGNASRAGSRDS